MIIIVDGKPYLEQVKELITEYNHNPMDDVIYMRKTLV